MKRTTSTTKVKLLPPPPMTPAEYPTLCELQDGLTTGDTLYDVFSMTELAQIVRTGKCQKRVRGPSEVGQAERPSNESEDLN